MGTFIDQVAKNNQLQQQILSEKRRKELQKQKEKREKQQEKSYKESLKTLQKELYNSLYFKISDTYKSMGVLAYEYLIINKTDIIQEVLDNSILTGVNEIDTMELKQFLYSKFNTINNFFNKEYREKEKMLFYNQAVEEEQQQEKTNIFEILTKIILFIFLFPIYIILTAGTAYNKKRQ